MADAGCWIYSCEIEFYKQLRTYDQKLCRGQFMGTVAEYLMQKGEQKGIQKGRQELARTIAQKMLKAKVDVKAISKFTGLKLIELKTLV